MNAALVPVRRVGVVELEAVRVWVTLPTRSMVTLLKVATPPTAVSVAVELAATAARVTVSELSVVSRLPYRSSTSTVGEGAMVWPAVMLVGCVPNTS